MLLTYCQGVSLAEAPEVKSPSWSINKASLSRAPFFGKAVTLSFLQFTQFARNPICVPKEMGPFVSHLWQVSVPRLWRVLWEVSLLGTGSIVWGTVPTQGAFPPVPGGSRHSSMPRDCPKGPRKRKGLSGRETFCAWHLWEAVPGTFTVILSRAPHFPALKFLRVGKGTNH